MTKKYKPGDILQVKVEKVVPRGRGLAFAEGLTIFVALAARGDIVNARLIEVKGRTAFAEIESLVKPSNDRTEPSCEYYGVCGGCDFQHLSYAAQLDAKTGIIKDALHRIGKIDLDGNVPIIPSPNEFGYRSRAQWHADTRGRHLGYFRRGSHDVVDIEHCPILSPALDNELAVLRRTFEWDGLWSEQTIIEAAAGSDGSVSISSLEFAGEAGVIAANANGERYEFDARTFFQGNLGLVTSLIEAAVGDVSGGHALDLYCGVGLFSLPLARKFRSVTGVEANAAAVDFAVRNAAAARLDNLRIFDAPVAEFLSGRDIGATDFVLLDPPRSGTEKGVVDMTIRLGAAKVSYVSCDPAMLARDLRAFLDAGYEIAALTALDLFPQTHHVETVARLSLK